MQEDAVVSTTAIVVDVFVSCRYLLLLTTCLSTTYNSCTMFIIPVQYCVSTRNPAHAKTLLLCVDQTTTNKYTIHSATVNTPYSNIKDMHIGRNKKTLESNRILVHSTKKQFHKPNLPLLQPRPLLFLLRHSAHPHHRLCKHHSQPSTQHKSPSLSTILTRCLFCPR
jgi:hypothetical protein